MLRMANMGVIDRTIKCARIDSKANRKRRVVGVSEHVFSVASCEPIRFKPPL